MPYLITAFLIILLGSTFGIESLSSLQVWSMTFSQKDKVNFSPNKMFLTVKAVNMEIKANENFGDSNKLVYTTCLVSCQKNYNLGS